jgi:hypothetical protein
MGMSKKVEPVKVTGEVIEAVEVAEVTEGLATPKQVAFADALAAGHSPVEAARIAGSPPIHAVRASRSAGVIARHESKFTAVGFDPKAPYKALKALISQNKDPAARLGAIKVYVSLMGLDAQKQIEQEIKAEATSAASAAVQVNVNNDTGMTAVQVNVGEIGEEALTLKGDDLQEYLRARRAQIREAQKAR